MLLLFLILPALDKFYVITSSFNKNLIESLNKNLQVASLLFSDLHERDFHACFCQTGSINFLHYLSEISQHQRVKGFMNNSTQLMCNYPATWYFKVKISLLFHSFLSASFFQVSLRWILIIKSTLRLTWRVKNSAYKTLTLRTTTWQIKNSTIENCNN